MQAHQLDANKKRRPKRSGRGISAGRGKTAGRGTKGQKSRTGKKLRPGFEGGQLPLAKRLPKLPGFTSHRTRPEVVYTSQIQSLDATSVNNKVLADAGLISSEYVKVKLITKGELTKTVKVELQAASASAVEAIEKAGGSFNQIKQVMRPASSQEKADS